MSAERFAPAKVNLFLHVGPVNPDGFHPLCSLATFADVGDVVRLEPAEVMGFAVSGPYAPELALEADNLVTRARDARLASDGVGAPPFRLTLDKRLPVAAGLGGGSADAAAALRLVDELVRRAAPDDGADLFAIAATLGSDVPMCLAGAPCLAEGRGEVLSAPPAFPDLAAVLVNPGVASPTGKVYGAYDAMGAPGGADRPAWPLTMETPEAVAAFLARCRNDLEAPAVALARAIGEALELLRDRPQALLARMSGLSATCFAICAGKTESEALAREVAALRPAWWVRACTFAGGRP